MTEFLSTADAAIGRMAGRQHGVVTSVQVEAAGIDKDGIAWRVRTGRLHRLHRGVYAVGHRSLSWRGRWLAAVLAAGDGAVLSHTSAAALWQFLVAMEDDHARDLALRSRGIETRRYIGDQLEAAPEAVVADLREALGRAS